MTVEASVQCVDGKDLIGLANYALLCLRQNPFVSSVKEITPTFIFDLAVILFGSEHIPFPVPSCPLHDLANFEAIVNTLSKEIGAQLDHINPEDLLLGRRKTVSHMIEILAAFIGYCLEEDLLDFDAFPNSISSNVAEIHSNEDTCCSTKSLEYPDFQLCISPELPRLSAVRTVCPTSSLHQSCHLLESSQSNAQLVINTPVTSSSTEVMTSATIKHTDCLNSKSDLNFLGTRSDYDLPNYSLFHRIYPSILSGTSPPATPKAMNELFEITHSKSPEINAPSLKCSPVSQTSFYNQSIPRGQSLGLVSVDCAPNNCTSSLEVNPVCKVSDFSVFKKVQSEDIPLMEVKSKVLNSTEQDLPSSNSFTLPKDITHIHKYKNDSSSSGRGHSATNTPTSHCLSTSTLPPSWTESLGFGDMNCFSKNVDVSLEKSGEHCQNTWTNKSVHSSNSVSTESILAWQQNVSNEDNRPLDTFYDLASVLSSSLGSDFDSKTDNYKTQPPASVLLNRTEKFVQVFKRRLDYLRNISVRAHTEAQTLYRLVQLLSSQNADVVRSINDQLIDICKTNLNSAHETNMKRIEHLLQNILMNVNTLMKHAESDCFYSHKYNQKHNKKSSTKINEKKHKTSKYCSNNNDLDFEFDKLMNLKHKCMVKALSLCLEQLQPKSVPIPSYVENSRQTLTT